jgi:hypothetical protein
VASWADLTWDSASGLVPTSAVLRLGRASKTNVTTLRRRDVRAVAMERDVGEGDSDGDALDAVDKKRTWRGRTQQSDLPETELDPNRHRQQLGRLTVNKLTDILSRQIKPFGLDPSARHSLHRNAKPKDKARLCRGYAVQGIPSLLHRGCAVWTV